MSKSTPLSQLPNMQSSNQESDNKESQLVNEILNEIESNEDNSQQQQQLEQQMQQQQMQQHFFQNQRYSFGDFDTKKITLFYSGSGTMISSDTNQTVSSNVITTNSSGTSSSYVTATYDNSGNFVFNLVEPISIDKMSDVFLDSFSILNCSSSSGNASGTSLGAVLKFNEINQNNFSNNG